MTEEDEANLLAERLREAEDDRDKWKKRLEVFRYEVEVLHLIGGIPLEHILKRNRVDA